MRYILVGVLSPASFLVFVNPIPQRPPIQAVIIDSTVPERKEPMQSSSSIIL
jgi:hypothetical protein